MKEIKLMSLELCNFKGIKAFIFEPDGGSVNVFGDNATGKTTLCDAFYWLLFDKNSQGLKQFAIKTYNKDRKMFGESIPEFIPNLNHEVIATLEIDGEQLTLKKTYCEKWTKKRNSATEEFTGHSTDYHIDDIPVKKSEYEAKIAEICDEDIFRLLTDIRHFNENLKWNERRELLLEVCGDVTDQEVIESNDKLSKLSEILGKRSVDAHRKYLSEQMRIINKDLEKIPTRVDEVYRSMPELSEEGKAEIEKKLAKLKKQAKDKEQEIHDIKEGGEVAKKKQHLSELQTELNNEKNRGQESVREEREELQKKKDELRDDVDNIKSEIRLTDSKVERRKYERDSAKAEAEKLREKWKQVNAKRFNADGKCPECGSQLPEDQVDKYRENFNLEKSKELEEIAAQGKEMAKKWEKLDNEIKELNLHLSEWEENRTEAEEYLKDIESQIKNLQNAEVSERQGELKAEIEGVKEAISLIEQSREGSLEKADNELMQLIKESDELQVKLNQYANIESSKARIEELKKEEKKLAKEYENMQSQLFLTEQFVKSKVNMLEEKINSFFSLARFKMFNVQINGGIDETCETMVNGVTYGNLNHGMKINVGLDIIQALQNHYGIKAPIFVDNKESITQLLEIDTQVISLIVSEKDKKLRVET